MDCEYDSKMKLQESIKDSFRFDWLITSHHELMTGREV